MPSCTAAKWATTASSASTRSFSIGRYCTIGANALVTQGQEIPDYSVVLGSPGKVVREIDPSEGADLEKGAAGYVSRAREYLNALHSDIRFS